MSTNFEQEIQDICVNLEINNLEHFSFRGIQYPSPGLGGAQHKVADIAELIRRIGECLYEHCYIRKCDPGQLSSKFETGTELPPNLTELLNQANHTQAAWDFGWRIYQVGGDGKIFVQKGDRSRAAFSGTYLIDKMKNSGVQVGDFVALHVYPSTNALQQAFFHSYGSQFSDQFDDFSAVRIYFNIDASSATTLLTFLSTRLNAYLVPFHFKTLVEAQHYDRADAAVLYIARRYYQIVSSLIEELPSLLGAGLRSEVPLFCLALFPGIGLAEDPATGESFGMHRCRILAEALVYAWQHQMESSTERFHCVEKKFLEYGLMLAAPYLNPRSKDIFAKVNCA
ncbi:T3SS effector HopA1 family protein [Undibacterium fentianense]|uniref:Uncharacterized protein n=1 Tax=Undibacterium fentianense TaxID=2828728 RepID=A0A941IG13_9BURK|nr:T3SS effector HopA1 family protein [Undibacterium fentianense]MBR7799560.1 hypothetical protein [Undibacterium fentianense]